MTSTILLGAHSMVGWSVFQASLEDDIHDDPIPVCSTSTRAAACRDWVRVNLDEGIGDLDLLATADRVIYCAGICHVRRCEENPDFARQVNVDGVQALIDALPASARLVYVSTDHVFGGVPGPCDETTTPVPISVYGQTRIEAESLVRQRPGHLIVRVPLGIGPSVDGRNGHLDWLRSRTARGLPMSIVTEEARSTVWASDLGRRIWDLAQSDIEGLRHVAATRVVGRPQLAAHLVRTWGLETAFGEVSRHALPYPHLGRVELVTRYRDALAEPLPSPLDGGVPIEVRPN